MLGAGGARIVPLPAFPGSWQHRGNARWSRRRSEEGAGGVQPLAMSVLPSNSTLQNNCSEHTQSPENPLFLHKPSFQVKFTCHFLLFPTPFPGLTRSPSVPERCLWGLKLVPSRNIARGLLPEPLHQLLGWCRRNTRPLEEKQGAAVKEQATSEFSAAPDCCPLRISSCPLFL